MAVRSGRAGASARADGTPLRFALAALGVALSHGGARAQTCDVFGPLDAGARVSQAVSYDQIWSTPVRTGGDWTMVWSAGQNVVTRRFSNQLVALGGEVLVNSTLMLDIQDEPSIGVATGGNALIAWSERYGYDGEQMGIFGRLFNAAGAPLGAEFQINQLWAASQWRPLVVPTPAGGFVVTWSGDWDGDSYFRVLSSTGAPLTGDVVINQYEFDAQVDPDVAVAPNGTIFAVFVDFSSHGGVGTNLNLWGRRFSATGVPLGNEFAVPSTYVNGDQRLPRIGVDSFGRFVIVWQDALADGSSWGIAARRFDVSGVSIGNDVLVNQITTGSQTSPVLTVDADGTFLVAWEDHSLGSPRIRGRRFGADAVALGPEFAMTPAGVEAERPALAPATSGGVNVLGYDVWTGSDFDVYARRFIESAGPQVYCTAKLNSQGCLPFITSSGNASLSSGVPFTIGAANVLNQKYGLLVYGSASAFTPFQGATLCVSGPRRIGAQLSGGTVGPPNCTGTFAFDFNAFARSGADPTLVAGTTVSAQWYYRDVLDPTGFGSGLTNALRFTLCP